MYSNICLSANSLPLSDKNALSVLQYFKYLWPNNAIVEHRTFPMGITQRYIELPRGSRARLNKPWYSVLMQKPLKNTSYLQLGGMNELFSQRFNICTLQSKVLRLSPFWLLARQQWLMVPWFWSFCCNCKPVDSSRRLREDKFGMVRELQPTAKMPSLLNTTLIRLHWR